ncbi:MAG: hypothetical protein DIU68_020130 [Chloroflexota bacterium]|nr:MAG: hypothetical protein DIU68_20275 [Chloroflexota bacterium]
MPKFTVWLVRVSLLYLGVGFTFGALMLANKGIPFAPQLWLLLPAHIEFLLLGWTIQLAMGVAFWILPRLPQEPKFGNVRLAWAAFALLNAGLLVSAGQGVLGLAAGWGLVGRALQLAGVICFAVQIWPRVRPVVIEPPASQ